MRTSRIFWKEKSKVKWFVARKKISCLQVHRNNVLSQRMVIASNYERVVFQLSHRRVYPVQVVRIILALEDDSTKYHCVARPIIDEGNQLQVLNRFTLVNEHGIAWAVRVANSRLRIWMSVNATRSQFPKSRKTTSYVSGFLVSARERSKKKNEQSLQFTFRSSNNSCSIEPIIFFILSDTIFTTTPSAWRIGHRIFRIEITNKMNEGVRYMQ